MAAITALATGMKELVLFTNAVLSTRLHETMYVEVEAPKNPINPRKRKLPAAFDEQPINPLKWACQPAATKEPPSFHGKYAKFDSNPCSEAPRIDGVAIPQHLEKVIRRDAFDLTDGQGSRVAARLGDEFYVSGVSKEKLTEYYNKQSSRKGRVEAILYRRKNQLPETNTATPAGDDGMDARGRMIDRVVWSDRENASNTSPSKRRGARSPTPIREPVYQQASKYSSETTFYATLAPTPTPEPVEYEQIELFSRVKGRPTKYPHISHQTLRQELNVRKFDAALEQAELRQKRGGLMINLEACLRRRSSDLGRNAKISDEYATAFEDWDRELTNSSASDDKRRAWCTTIWEMPGRS